MRKKTALGVGLGLAGAAGGLAAVSELLYRYIMKRGGFLQRLGRSKVYRKRHASKPAEHLHTAESMAFLRNNAQLWTLTARDGLQLCAYYLPQGDCRRTALLCHGYGESAMEISAVAKQFYDRGFAVLLPDARGHGRSQGAYIGMGWPERKDLCDWLRLLLRHTPETEVLLYGISMGGATVMAASGEALPPQVKCIIEDCGYASVWKELASQMQRRYRLPTFPLLHLLSGVSRRKAGYGFREADMTRQVARCRVPMLFIHGTADRFVPYAMLAEVYEAARCEKEKLEVEGAGHAAAMRKEPERYWCTVDAFWQKYLSTN